MTVSVYFPPTVQERSCSPHPLQRLLFVHTLSSVYCLYTPSPAFTVCTHPLQRLLFVHTLSSVYCLYTPSPAFTVCKLFDDGHSYQCEVISHCSFDLHFSKCQQIWKTQQWPQDWKRSVCIPIPKKGNAKECSNYRTIALISHASKVMLKVLQARIQ